MMTVVNYLITANRLLSVYTINNKHLHFLMSLDFLGIYHMQTNTDQCIVMHYVGLCVH